ncbi:exodeoxyribonuclease VII large subunit [Desulfobacula phenolica]|uniref:Exodeoxyribonuclease 7 large subunit n=1 Tax=Desulfobacula phenolica TaxID=90732 RepID=A0A1H2K3C4_9BACT|nr:exodeoxyribonuclease VII large subunit [Desulfobacula phenolica]SDU63053.1 Exodeoxyribonuclease VII large subunit [Desulfobacula phenolica]
MIITGKKTGQPYTVSKLTKEIKSLLEETYPFVWVTGEISNYAVPASGHSYFSLKDQQAVISAVMFKNQKRTLKFKPENGMKINGLARLTLYEPRGAYQLIFEYLEPEGAGSMQVAFEQLKKKLSNKGFFDDKYKKAIPFLPSKISVITSGTGAAVKDIINVAQRRFLNCHIEIISVKVQGDGSENEISDAINLVNQHQSMDHKISDIIILARGGGSLEDLAAFNSETVANAIFASSIPIITGVGHETDYTIADFVADLRAPTPSAAAELALPDKNSLVQTVLKLQESLTISVKKKIIVHHQTVSYLISRLKSPRTIIYDFRFKLEDYKSRLINMMTQYVQYKKEKLSWLSNSLHSRQPLKKIFDHQRQVKRLSNEFTHNFQKKIQQMKTDHLELTSKLQALNPKAVLDRGYSISRFVSDKKLITNSSDVKKNDQIEVILSKGQLITRVEKIKNG